MNKAMKKADLKIKEAEKQIKFMDKQINETFENLNYTRNRTYKLIEIVNSIVISSIIDPNIINSTTIVIIKNNSDGKYEYVSFQRTTDTIDEKLANHKKKYPNMKIILRINHNHGSINLCGTILETFNDTKKIKCLGHKFNLKKNYHETLFIYDIKMFINSIKNFEYTLN